MNGVTVVTVFAGWTDLLAVFTKEAFGAELVTACPIPASVTGDAPSLSHLTWLLALAVPTPGISQVKQKIFTLNLFKQKKPLSDFNVLKKFWTGTET